MMKELDPRDERNYSEAPAETKQSLRNARLLEDTLPPPEALIRKKQSITIRLDTDIVEWFKEQGGQYQTLINEVLRRYKDHFGNRRAG